MNYKREFLKYLKNQDIDSILQYFLEDPSQASRTLQLYVYGTPNDVIHWRAIDYMGIAAGKFAPENDELFRNVIRRYIWHMNEEGGNVPWVSGEIIGSIIANVEGKQFREFIGPWFYHVDLNEICYAGLYWALPHMMRYHKEKTLEFVPDTWKWFDKYDFPDMRAYAALFYADHPYPQMTERMKGWQTDTRSAWLYDNGQVQEKRVDEIVKQALEKLNA
jgi:hypothetical protein